MADGTATVSSTDGGGTKTTDSMPTVEQIIKSAETAQVMGGAMGPSTFEL